MAKTVTWLNKASRISPLFALNSINQIPLVAFSSSLMSNRRPADESSLTKLGMPSLLRVAPGRKSASGAGDEQLSGNESSPRLFTPCWLQPSAVSALFFFF